MLNRSSERVERAHAGIACPTEHQLSGATRGDHLVEDQVGSQADQGELAATLAN